MYTWLLELKCKLFRHELHWVYGSDVKLLHCRKCNLIHDVEVIPPFRPLETDI
jgi:hypothetical protein